MRKNPKSNGAGNGKRGTPKNVPRETIALKKIGQSMMLSRIEKEWTLEVAGVKSGISSGLISKIEKNKAENVNIGTLCALAEAYGKVISLDMV